MELAKEIIQESLPIKCLEAVVLSLYITVPILSLQRFPIGFKSIHNGKCHRYVDHYGIYSAITVSSLIVSSYMSETHVHAITILFVFVPLTLIPLISLLALSLSLHLSLVFFFLISHIVLGCYHNGLYGAVGLSRRPTLMFKPLTYKVLQWYIHG